MDAKPSVALRTGRRTSSMWLALEAVKKNEADVAVSAGNTGALMAMAKICLHMMPGLDRPAIAATWPTIRANRSSSILAQPSAPTRGISSISPSWLAMARIVLAIERPTVGLLNIGVEEIKGIDEVKTASRLLRESGLPNLDYHGFVEGDDIGKGTVDVVSPKDSPVTSPSRRRKAPPARWRNICAKRGA